VRKVERELIPEYRVLIEKAVSRLTVESYEAAIELAALPDMIRGYEDLKLRNVERFRAAVRERQP
jgi:indolepyruvate ferredoxin oxidoreductase